MGGVITLGIETAKHYSNGMAEMETQLLYRAGYGVMCTLISPHTADHPNAHRASVRNLVNTCHSPSTCATLSAVPTTRPPK